MARAWRGTLKNRDSALHVRGLAQLQKALRDVEGDVGPDLRKRLREVAEPARSRAMANVQHKTGRHGQEKKHLADTIKVGVTQRAVSIYSTSPYAAVQDIGGHVGHGAVIERAKASHYMTKAVQIKEAEAALQAAGRDIEQKYGRG